MIKYLYYCVSLFLICLIPACRIVNDVPQGDFTPSAVNAMTAAAAGNYHPAGVLVSNWGDGGWFVFAELAKRNSYPQVAQEARLQSANTEQTPFAPRSLATLIIQEPRRLWFPLQAIRKAEDRWGHRQDLRAARIAVLNTRGRRNALIRMYKEDFQGTAADAPLLMAALKKRVKGSSETASYYVLHCPDPTVLDVLSDLPSPSRRIYSALLHARIAFGKNNYEDALFFYRDWLNSVMNDKTGPENDENEILPPGYRPQGVPPVFEEIAKAAQTLKLQKEWAEQLVEAAASLRGPMRYGAAYQAGRLFSQIGRNRPAAEAFTTALEGTRNPGLARDRALWYRLRVLYRDPTFTSDEEMSILTKTWADLSSPGRFSDVMNQFLNRRIRGGEWRELERAYEDWATLWPASVRAQSALVLALSAVENRLSNDIDYTTYLEAAVSADPLSWGGLRSAGILNRPIASLPVSQSDESSTSSDHDSITNVFLRTGFADLAYDTVMESYETVSIETIRQTARVLAADKQPRRSIRITGLLWNKQGYRPTIDDLLLRHPLPYGDGIADLAEAESIPSEIFYGLIRTESAWDAAAISRSGAQGLAQFMPATWKEWVKRMGLPSDADPIDPETNMTLGAAYLSWLYNREWTFGWIDSLASYNAGGGRVRRWRSERPGLGDDLFGESIPYEEPRMYIRKVLAAATLYGYLYKGEQPQALHEAWGLPLFSVQ